MTENGTFDLESIILFFKKWFFLVMVFLLLGGVGGFGIAKYVMTPMYSSQSQIVIQQKHSGFTVSDVQSNIQLVNTYKMIIASPEVVGKVKKEMNLKLDRNTLSKQISIENSQDSQVLTVNVLAAKASEAKEINTLLLKETSYQAKRTLGVNGVRVLTAPTDGTLPVKPNVYLVTGIGILLGLFISILFILIWEFTHQTIRHEQDVQKLIDTPLLGNVDHF